MLNILRVKKTKKMIFLILSLIIFAVLLNTFISETTPIVGENSIATLEKVSIGGIDQWIMVRGEDKENPLILFLHGGPGSAEMPLIRKYNSELEKEFIVVAWDQRGAGKSYSNDIPLETMNLKQYLSDTNEIVEYLKKKYNKERIILIGHSWGTYLGMNIIKEHPEDYYAYIGTGQIVNGKKNEELAYNEIKEMAIKDNNKEAIEELEKIAVLEDGVYKNGLKGLEIQRKWMTYYGGFCYGKKSINHFYIDLLLAKEYSIIDKVNYIKGCEFSADAMWATQWIYKVQLDRDIREVNVPVYFCQGLHDLNTVYHLAKKYINELKAPYKGFITFTNSAHCVPYEESDEFNHVVKGIATELGLFD